MDRLDYGSRGGKGSETEVSVFRGRTLDDPAVTFTELLRRNKTFIRSLVLLINAFSLCLELSRKFRLKEVVQNNFGSFNELPRKSLKSRSSEVRRGEIVGKENNVGGLEAGRRSGVIRGEGR